MHALIFKAGEKTCAIGLGCVECVAPAFDTQGLQDEPPFSGFRDFGGEKIPVFDINFAVSGRKARRLFGTRHIIVKMKIGGKETRAALLAEGISGVREFPGGAKFASDSDAFGTFENGSESIVAVRPEILFGKARNG